jgi:hypothetical protein
VPTDKKAIIAVAAAMLRIAYHLLKDGTFYQELGPGYLKWPRILGPVA